MVYNATETVEANRMNARRILLLVGAALVVAIAPAAESAATAKTAGARLADAGVKAEVGAIVDFFEGKPVSVK